MSDEGWLQTAVTFPEMLTASPRKHNELMREAMVEELIKHRDETMPKHFQAGNAQRYAHKPRTPKYIAIRARAYGSTVDLVKTGRTRREFAQKVEPKVSGAAASNTLRGRLQYRLPFGGGTGRTMDDAARARLGLGARKSLRGITGVTPAQIVKELQTIAPVERADIATGLRNRYVEKLKKLKRPRLAAGVDLATL